VALVGVDDSAVARLMDPPLTSVRQPIEEMGRAMTRLLLRKIAEESEAGASPRRGKGEEPSRVLATQLAVRDSS
ncbi:substrate-binding domain-containing protein, partial [Streptomyces sp. NPDC048349]|uniref:substrate-binding domain-containing protein n=1 Tax=Streptomyces sp. NPDC048349 TaxID=3155486 RepID=UPI00343C9D74